MIHRFRKKTFSTFVVSAVKNTHYPVRINFEVRMWQDRAACGDFNNVFKMFIALSDHNHFNEQKHLVVVAA